MFTSDVHRRDETAEKIRRMASSPATRRYAAALPQFEVDPDLPDDMAELLEKLDRLKRVDR